MSREAQPRGFVGFVRACRAAAWLDYRTLRYHPASLVLAAVQQLTNVAVWYFVGRFLGPVGGPRVQAFGGDYAAYVLVGVLLNQVGLAALDGPFKTIAQAFWDKRLETYRLAVHGIWANIVGRLIWQVAFATVLQLVALVILLLVGGLHITAGIHLLGALLTILLLVGAHAGLGLAGASMFFLLEVKTGQDPITWVYRYLVMLVSGLYVPLTVLPDWLQGLGAALPQTYALTAVRALLLSGAGWDSPPVVTSLLWLALLTVGALAGGVVLLDLALRRAERHGGIGVVV